MVAIFWTNWMFSRIIHYYLLCNECIPSEPSRTGFVTIANSHVAVDVLRNNLEWGREGSFQSLEYYTGVSKIYQNNSVVEKSANLRFIKFVMMRRCMRSARGSYLLKANKLHQIIIHIFKRSLRNRMGMEIFTKFLFLECKVEKNH